MSFKTFIGFSKEKNSFQAGKESAEKCFHGIGEIQPNALIIFGSPVYNHNDLLRGICSVFPGTPMVGGTTGGEIALGQTLDDSVTVLALYSDEIEFISGIGNKISLNERNASRELIDDIKSKSALEDRMTLFIFPDGLSGDGVEIINGLHDELGKNFEIIGGHLGDKDNFQKTYQYYNGKVYEDSIPGLLIKWKKGFNTGIGVRSGFESIGNRFYCTESEGNTVIKFDDERALDLYKKFLGDERAARLPSICLEYPFGLIDDRVSIAGKEYFQLRCGLTVDQERGVINLAGSIPEGSALTLTTASRGDIIHGARMAAEQALDNLDGAEPALLIIFSCIGRKLVLGRRTQEEISTVREVFGKDIPMIGFHTYGEIGPIDKSEEALSVAKFHNETMIIWAIGRK